MYVGRDIQMMLGIREAFKKYANSDKGSLSWKLDYVLNDIKTVFFFILSKNVGEITTNI